MYNNNQMQPKIKDRETRKIGLKQGNNAEVIPFKQLIVKYSTVPDL